MSGTLGTNGVVNGLAGRVLRLRNPCETTAVRMDTIRSPGNPASTAVEPPALDALSTPVWIFDTFACRVHWANAAALSLWEASDLDELRARDLRTDTSQAVESTLRDYLDEFAAGRRITCWWQLSPGGTPKNVLCRFSGIEIEPGRPAMLCEGLLLEGADSGALSDSVMIVSAYDADGRLVSSNPPFRAVFDDEMDDIASLFADAEAAQRLLEGARSEGERAHIDALVLTRDGLRWHALELHRRQNGTDSPALVLLQTDIHERKARELEHARQALTDALTGLRNRTAIEQELRVMHGRGRPFVLFYIDLDGFKPINDTFGHALGDTILRQVAERLETLAGDGATVARIGGDEFIIAAESGALSASPEAFATWIVSSISRPYPAGHLGSLSLSTSVGVAHFPDHGSAIDELLANADTAMYAAKSQGRRRWITYAPGMRDRVQRRTLIAQELPGAGARGELSLVYQPIVVAPDNGVLAVEALLRWRNPRLGVIEPLETVAAAEDTGVIAELDEWVLTRAGRDLRRLRQKFGSQLLANVNISGRHLAQPGFVERLQRVIDDMHLLPGDIVLELTEGAMVPDAFEEGTPVAELAAVGHPIAIDDFGTGYSCLAYLHQLPANYVKIDRAFVSRLETDSNTIGCIHALARGLDMLTVGEGVETRAQASLLLEQGVVLQQGYLHSHPQPLRKLLEDGLLAN